VIRAENKKPRRARRGNETLKHGDKIMNSNHPNTKAPDTAQICAPVTQAEAAKLLNVSRRSVQHAAVVIKDGVPELQAAVESGNVAVSTASEITTLPPEEQTEIVAKGKAEIIKKAKEIRQAKTKNPAGQGGVTKL
jgi:hypothetical protein